MKISLEKRELKKKKINKLFEEGVIPAVVYGPKRESVNVKMDIDEFEKIFEKAEYNKLIDIEIQGEKKKGKALIREVQYDPITDEIIHASFYDLDLKKEIVAEIPVETKGVAKAVDEGIGFLVTPLNTIPVRCLPKDLPEEIVIEVSGLEKIGDSISLGDIELPKGVKLSEALDEKATIAYITPPQKELEVEEEEVAVEGEEVEGEEVEGEEGEEGEVGEGGEETPEGEEVEGETEEKAEGTNEE